MNEQLELAPEIVAAINAGRKLEAIRLLREEYGMGLVEAKDVVEELTAASESVRNSAGPQPLRMETGLGRLVLLVLIIAAAVAGYWLAG
jgi:hypothetical protein